MFFHNLTLLFGSAVEAAKGDSYVGAGITHSTISVLTEDENTQLISGKYGYFIHPNFSIEGRLSLGVSEVSTTDEDGSGTLKTPHIIGFYGVGHYNINDSFSVHGLIGLSSGEVQMDLTSSNPDDQAAYSILSELMSETITSLSVGAGASYQISDKISVNLEYTSYLNGDIYDLSAITFGAIFKL